MNHRTIIDARFDTIDGEPVDPTDAASCRECMGRALDDGVDLLIVAGDDATLAALATAQAEAARRRSEALSFALLAAGEQSHVAAQIDAAKATSRAHRKLVRRLEGDSADRHAVATLRVVDAADAQARLAFSFGMGALTDLAAAGRMRRRDAVRRAVSGSKAVDAVVRIDWDDAASSFGYLIASSLKQSWARVEMGEGATVRLGDSPLELVRGATRLGRVVERAAGGTARPFSCVHIDTNSDYVVDGLNTSGGPPRLIALTPGPRLHVLA